MGYNKKLLLREFSITNYRVCNFIDHDKSITVPITNKSSKPKLRTGVDVFIDRVLRGETKHQVSPIKELKFAHFLRLL